jgi:hypothetical protein
VEISGLTIANGLVFDVGGGIFNAGTLTITNSTLSGNSAGGGGGIFSSGTLTINSSTLSGNSASFNTRFGSGGGISSSGTPTINSSALSGNSANGFGSSGGGISSSGTLTINSSTLSGNSANVFNATGGGIYNTGALSVTSSTLSGNSAGGGGGIFISTSATVTALRNTILAGNTAPGGPDVSGPLNSQGHNLIGDGTRGSGFDPTDLVGTSTAPIDPMLGPLADNGGPTQTMALLPGSPAVGAGDPTDAPQFDQRGPGFARIVNGMIDIGAFEVQQAVVPTVTCSVAKSLLWPPNHQLVNVGLNVTVTPPDAILQVQVYANDQAASSDAQDIAPETLQLRADRSGHSLGRVYLIVATATNSAGSAFNVCSVVVPHSNNPLSIAIVRVEAFLAEVWYGLLHTAPPGFHLIGAGPAGGSAAPSSAQPGRSAIPADIFGSAPAAPAAPVYFPNQASLFGVAGAAPLAASLSSTRNALSWDGYFADHGRMTRRDSAWWNEANGLVLDLVLKDDSLVV